MYPASDAEDAASRKSGNPQTAAAQEGASRRVGTCRHDKQTTSFVCSCGDAWPRGASAKDFADGRSPGRVLPGVSEPADNSDLEISRFEKQVASSLSTFNIDNDPALEDANNILARWNKSRERKHQDEQTMCPSPSGQPEKIRKNWNSVPQTIYHTALVEPCHGRLCSSWSPQPDEQHLWSTHWIGWTARELYPLGVAAWEK